jgi:hypothetical protein
MNGLIRRVDFNKPRAFKNRAKKPNMKIAQIVSLVFNLYIAVGVLDSKPISAQKPVLMRSSMDYRSSNMVGAAASIKGAADLYLVANDAGSGS